MKNVILLFFFLSVISQASFGQTKKDISKLNLDFEELENGLPKGWELPFPISGYSISPDSTFFQSGKQAIAIEYTKENKQNAAFLAITLPQNYDGKTITLSGYIKTENVSEGYAGLWMKIDPMIAIDFMEGRGATGTTDWAKYEITLRLDPNSTKQILVGALLMGKGKAWFDNFNITIDGKDIAEVKPYIRELLPAEKDKEFDMGSNIHFPSLNNEIVTNLELLGKLWGFLKYHHPEVGKGNYNWDYELFRILPKYLEANDTQLRDDILLNWIASYGEVETCSTCKPTAENAFLKPNLAWINDYNLSSDLKESIKHIYTNRHQGKHFYIGLSPYAGNPLFRNENSYKTMSYPDAGFRLLSLYRYWNMIQYFNPNTYLTDKPWSKVLKEYIPVFLSAQSELEYELAALRIIGDISDTHATLSGEINKIKEHRGNYFSPFRVEFVQDKLVIIDYYNPELVDKDELKIGDIITHINGKSVEAIVDSLRIYYPASNEPTRLRDISADILRSNKNNIQIKYLSSGKEKLKKLTLYPKNELNIYLYKENRNEKCYKLLEGNIGYVTLANIKDEDVNEIKTKFKDTKGMIIDIRNYPSAGVMYSLGAYFVSDTTDFVKFTTPNINNPGEFNFTPNIKILNEKETYQRKLVVLVNEHSQSQAEFTAMALIAGNSTTIVGSTTAGADGNISQIELPGGLITYISGLGVYYPDGGQTQRVGIIPDVRVDRTIQGIKEGKDEILEKAIEIINKSK